MFALGLVLVVLAGSELLTGNMALVPIAMMRRRVGFGALGLNFTVVLIGNLIGSLFVAYFLAVKTGVIGQRRRSVDAGGLTFERLKAIAVLKGDTEGADQIFLRALGCNWLVCLAVWVAMTAEDTGGKILGIFFPIMAFVAIGFDHVVANMFFLPAAIFADVPGVSWGDALYNWVFAFLGNLVGAAVFVSTGYWYLYLRGTPDEAAAPGHVRSRTTTAVPPASGRPSSRVSQPSSAPGGSSVRTPAPAPPPAGPAPAGPGRSCTPPGRAITRWSMSTSDPTRQVHERGASTAVIRDGNRHGAEQPGGAARRPRAPRRRAPTRRAGAAPTRASGRAATSSAHAASGITARVRRPGAHGCGLPRRRVTEQVGHRRTGRR